MRRVFLLGACAPLALAIGGAACKSFEAQPPPPFQVELHVTSDPGVALESAAVVYQGKTVATTGPTGVALLTLRGAEGEAYDVFVQCPSDYQSPTKPVTIFLRRLEGAKLPRYEASCPPAVRSVVVAVRAENGPNLPVLYLGQAVARTDSAGAALVLLKLKPGDQFDLTLGTSNKEGELLRPQNPTASFVVKQQDDVMLFDQRFAVERRPYVGPAAPTGPTHL
jgi:hypothetical protein